MSRKVKTISFSHVSEYDSKLLEYAESKERGSFSQYIKRLIDNDMRGVVKAQPIVTEVVEDTSTMSGFL